jgi:protein transport protein SEC20
MSIEIGTETGTEIDTEISRLHTLKDRLSMLLYSIENLRDEDTKEKIFGHLNQYHESLDFLKSELEFEYGIDLHRTQKGDVVDLCVQYDLLGDFLTSFQQNLIQKQLELKQTQLSKFDDLKREKYTRYVVPDAPGNAVSADQPISQDAKIMNTTRKITSKLVQSSQILQSSLVQSQLNIDELEIQGDSLTYLADKNDLVGGILTKSEGFIQDIRLSSMKDKKRMYYALAFFALCVAKVFWGRVFKYPVWIIWRLFWYVVRMALATFGLVSRHHGNGPLNVLETSSLEDIITATVEVISETTEDLVEKIEDTVSTADTLEEALGRIIDEL